MFSQKSVYDVKTNTERFYRFECDPNAPLQEVKVVLKHIDEEVDKLIEKLEKQNDQVEEEKSAEEKEVSDA